MSSTHLARLRRLMILGIVASAAVALGWLSRGPTAPAIYDSGLPPPPFRAYCNPPAGQPLVTGKHLVVPAQGGQSPAVSFTTDEPVVPQLQLLASAGSLMLPAGTTQLVIDARPVMPPQTLPTDGAIDGNVYTLAATVPGGASVPLTQPATVVLRGVHNGGDAVVERFDGSIWGRLTTQPVGQQDIWGANVTQLGTFALVNPGKPGKAIPCSTAPGSGGSGSAGAPPAATPPNGGSGSSSSAVVIVLAAAGGVGLLLAAGLLFVLRGGRERGGGGGRGGGGRDRGRRRRP